MLPRQILTEKLDWEFFSVGEGATCFAKCGEALYIGAERSLYRFQNGKRYKLSGYTFGVQSLASDGETLYVAFGNTVRALTKDGGKTDHPFDSSVLKVAAGGGKVWALTKNALYRLEDGAFQNVQATDLRPVDLTVTDDGDAWVLCEHALHVLMAKRERFGTRFPGMTGLPSCPLYCLTCDTLGTLWLGTEEGVYLYDGKSEWIAPEQSGVFPRCPVKHIAFGKDNVLLSTDSGLYAVSGKETAWYCEGRYLLDNRVKAAFSDGDTLYVGTGEGMSVLTFVPMTLSRKEEYYRSVVQFFDRDGYVTRRVGTTPGDFSSGRVQITDNDGLFSADWIVSESIRYALTGDAEARNHAKRSMEALWKLETVSGIPGFPARAVRRPGEEGFGNGHHEWHLTEDERGPVEWKGETSSDELVGHFFASAWYFDLCADEAEKKTIAENLGAILTHILEHEWTLHDADGKPTSWAHFGPDDLNADESWSWEKGGNALEILSFLLIGYHVTGNAAYLEKRRELIKKHHYALNMLCYKKDDAHSNHIDDRLTAYVGMCLIRYETDEALLRLYRFALRRHYSYIRDEGYVFAAILYSVANTTESEGAVIRRALAKFPFDLSYYKTDLSKRWDFRFEERTALFGEEPHSKTPLPRPERLTEVMHDGGREYLCNTDSAILSPCCWLVSYWTARYFDLLTAED